MKTSILLLTTLFLSACASQPRPQGTRACQYGEDGVLFKPTMVYDYEASRETACRFMNMFLCAEEVVKIDPKTKEILYKAPRSDKFEVVADLMGDSVSYRKTNNALVSALGSTVANVMGAKGALMINMKAREVVIRGTLMGKETEERTPFSESCQIEQVAVATVFKKLTTGAN
jgi:hypothetical protein